MSTFSILQPGTGTRARLGRLATPHGEIRTPAFMPVGTQGTVKAMRMEDVATMGADVVLANTYHLYLRPGQHVVQNLGGLHRFMNWSGPILTDSGGFQVFSLGRDPEQRQRPRDEAGQAPRPTKLARIKDDGVEFLSHIDGSHHFMTPALSIEIQLALGSDILMVFDDCTPYPASEVQVRESLERTLRWEEQSLNFFMQHHGDGTGHKGLAPLLMAIVQGGLYPNLRRECFEKLYRLHERSTNQGFASFALGGFSVGEPINQMYELCDFTAQMIPDTFPRYLMGVGMPEDIVRCIDYGIDLFDCVIPTRNARNGMLFTSSGYIQIKQAQYASDPSPIDQGCTCYTCVHYSRGYLRHVHMANEIISSMLSTIHNLHYYLDLLGRVRSSLETDSFVEFKRQFFKAREQSS